MQMGLLYKSYIYHKYKKLLTTQLGITIFFACQSEHSYAYKDTSQRLIFSLHLIFILITI